MEEVHQQRVGSRNDVTNVRLYNRFKDNGLKTITDGSLVYT